jgi:aminoglycoside phosphotransferase (APT) family kinase protein
VSSPGELAPVRSGEELDWRALETFLRSSLDELPADAMSVQQFPRGSANLTYLLRFGDLELVLRRPPFGKPAPGAHDMGREHSILSRLWRVYPRAPRAWQYCEDASVVGAPFVVQEYRGGGEVIFDRIPEAIAGLPDLGGRLTGAMADALVDLHQVDYMAAGLSDLGRPEGFVHRQVSGWRDRWRRVAPTADSAMERVADALERQIPAAQGRAIVHNDFKLNNCQFRPSSPDAVVSVFDWDMATLGDPLIDVGIVLDYWSSMQTGSGLRLPPKAAFARLYAQRTGVPVEAFDWYEAFACWRKGVVVQQLYDRYAKGLSRDERLKDLGDRAPAYAEQAQAILSGDKQAQRQ